MWPANSSCLVSGGQFQNPGSQSLGLGILCNYIFCSVNLFFCLLVFFAKRLKFSRKFEKWSCNMIGMIYLQFLQKICNFVQNYPLHHKVLLFLLFKVARLAKSKIQISFIIVKVREINNFGKNFLFIFFIKQKTKIKEKKKVVARVADFPDFDI